MCNILKREAINNEIATIKDNLGIHKTDEEIGFTCKDCYAYEDCNDRTKLCDTFVPF